MARACCWREWHSVRGQPHHIAHLPQGACLFSKPEPGQTLGQGHISIDQEDKHIQQTRADSHVCWEGRGAARQEESQTRRGEGGPSSLGPWATEMELWAQYSQSSAPSGTLMVALLGRKDSITMSHKL